MAPLNRPTPGGGFFPGEISHNVVSTEVYGGPSGKTVFGTVLAGRELAQERGPHLRCKKALHHGTIATHQTACAR